MKAAVAQSCPLQNGAIDFILRHLRLDKNFIDFLVQQKGEKTRRRNVILTLSFSKRKMDGWNILMQRRGILAPKKDLEYLV